MINKLFFLLGCTLFWACASSPDYSGQKSSRPNILWITCEDISPNLGAYGDQYANTPHLDQLAKEGVLYNNAFASAPVCAVARSGIITGMYASSQGSQHMRCNARVPKGIKMYPELLREAGYYCTNNSKTDYNFAMDHKSIWDECNGDAHFENRPNKEQPFFSIFNFTTSHESRVNDEDRYQDAIKNLNPDQLKKPGNIPLPPYYPNTPEVRELWARYYNIITAMDQQVGDILRKLKEEGLEEKTIVIFYSDHGAGIPRHKRWMYDSGLQVPMIVKVPEKYKSWLPHSSGTATDELVSFIDLAPTALNLTGIPIPRNMQGRAFLGDSLSAPRNYVYAGRDRMDERYDMQRSVRDKRFLYVRYYEPYKSFCQYMNTPEKGAIMQSIRAAQANSSLPPAGQKMVAPTKPPEELFDCVNDPYQLNNLAGLAEYQDKLQEMRRAHAEWSDDTKDTGLIPETILRKWEKENDMAIYDLMRNKPIPITDLRRTALGDAEISTLRQNLQHDNEAVQYWAAISLGNKIKNVKNYAELKLALNDETPVVRFAAARALALAGQINEALPILNAGLQHEDEWVRLNAAQVLDEMGEQARPSLENLQSVMEDKNKYVVRVANHAINELLGTDNVVQ